MSVLAFPASSLLAAAFSSGGDGGRRRPDPKPIKKTEGVMTDRQKYVFNEMLAALKAVVNCYGAPPHADTAAIAKAKSAIAKAEVFERRDRARYGTPDMAIAEYKNGDLSLRQAAKKYGVTVEDLQIWMHLPEPPDGVF